MNTQATDEKKPAQGDERVDARVAALMGCVGTLIQALVADGVVSPDGLQERLQSFVQQDAVQALALRDADRVRWVVDSLLQGVELGRLEQRPSSLELTYQALQEAQIKLR